MSHFQLIVSAHFSGAHALRGYEGSCARLHGHNFRVEARVMGSQLNEVGILVDFKRVKKMLTQIVDLFDHQVINEISPFDAINPTAEHLARFIYERLAPELESQGAKLDSVGIWETESYGAVYSDNN